MATAQKDMPKEEDELAFALLTPSGREVLKAVMGGAGIVTEIVEKTGIDRGLVLYHLDLLEESSILKSEYKIIKEPTATAKGLASSVFSVNKEKLSEAVKAFKELYAEPVEQLLQGI